MKILNITHIQLFVFYIFILTLPIYIWESGLPQVSHIIGIFLFLIILTIKKGKLFIGFPGKIIVLFVFYSFLVNMFFFVSYPEFRFLLSTSYFIYNFLVFTGIVNLYIFMAKKNLDKYFFKITVFAIISAVLLEFLFIILNLKFNIKPQYFFPRISGTFNNPNQLANWVISVFYVYFVSIIALKKEISILNVLGSALLFIPLVILSASKAGLITITAIYMFLLIPFISRFFKHIILFSSKRAIERSMVRYSHLLLKSAFTIFLISITYFISKLNFIEEYFEFSIYRIEQEIFEKKDMDEDRGYDRLKIYPEYLILGAGEGKYDRFPGEKFDEIEIHSTFAGIIFYYGIPGFLLFSTLLIFFLFKMKDKYLRFLFLGPIIMSLGHYNVRNTMLWLFLAFSYIYILRKQRVF